MKQIILFSIFIIALASCRKVIKIKTKDGDVKTVIVANLEEGNNIARVKISKSINLNDKNDFPQVSGAIVTITDNAGGVYVLPETTELGTYELPVTGVIGRVYTLKVDVSGKVYNATCTMYGGTDLDTINSFKNSFGDEYSVQPIYFDPAGIRNYTRFLVYTNGILQPALFLADDEFSDGIVQTNPIFGDYDAVAGDSILIVKQAIDPNVYKYLLDLSNVSDGGSGSASPTNPKSNIDNGAFGYFSAFSSKRKAIKVAP